MNWEQKLMAIQALGDTFLKMREPGNWYVHTTGLEVGGDGMLRGVGGDGSSPERAVEDRWEKILAIGPPLYLVINAYRDNRRQVRWNGYMWLDIPVQTVP